MDIREGDISSKIRGRLPSADEGTRQAVDRAGADVIALIKAALEGIEDGDSRVQVALACAVPAMVAAVLVLQRRYGVSERVALDVLRRLVTDVALGTLRRVGADAAPRRRMMMPPALDVRSLTTCPMRAADGGADGGESPGRRRDPRAWCCELVGAINAVKLHRDRGGYQRLARAVALAPTEGLSADWWEVVSRCEDWLKCNFGRREPAPLVVGLVLARACAHPPAPLPHWQSPREWQ